MGTALLNKTKPIRTASKLSLALVALLAISGCSGASVENNAAVENFDPANYVDMQGTEPLTDSLERFNLAEVVVEEGSLETAFKQAAINSQYLLENAGAIQREDFRDGEFMTYVYAPVDREVDSGYWYTRKDGTSAYGQIFSPLEFNNEEYELPITSLDSAIDFTPREFSLYEENVIEVNFGDFFVFRYTIEEDVITQIERVSDSGDPQNNTIVLMEYGDTAKIIPLLNQIESATASD
jgi:hypothetical protein